MTAHMQVQVALVELLGHVHIELESWKFFFVQNKHHRNCTLFSKLMTVHKKILVPTQARHLVEKKTTYIYRVMCETERMD
jgi:hypothetical protein